MNSDPGSFDIRLKIKLTKGGFVEHLSVTKVAQQSVPKSCDNYDFGKLELSMSFLSMNQPQDFGDWIH